MPASPSLFGVRKAGYIPMTRVAGSNGTVAITWGGVRPLKMPGRSSAGRRCGVTYDSCNSPVNLATFGAGGASGRRYYTGPTTAGVYKGLVIVSGGGRLSKALRALMELSVLGSPFAQTATDCTGSTLQELIADFLRFCHCLVDLIRYASSQPICRHPDRQRRPPQTSRQPKAGSSMSIKSLVGRGLTSCSGQNP
jgi:hypothetical protein